MGKETKKEKVQRLEAQALARDGEDAANCDAGCEGNTDAGSEGCVTLNAEQVPCCCYVHSLMVHFGSMSREVGLYGSICVCMVQSA